MKKKSLIPKQEFTLNAPEAAAAFLAGDFTQWKQDPVLMKRSKAGVWKTTVNLKPGTYHYRFLVDGEWRDDPTCKLHAPNPFGTQDAIRVVA